jgi:hypothetical protein
MVLCAVIVAGALLLLARRDHEEPERTMVPRTVTQPEPAAAAAAVPPREAPSVTPAAIVEALEAARRVEERAAVAAQALFEETRGRLIADLFGTSEAAATRRWRGCGTWGATRRRSYRT